MDRYHNPRDNCPPHLHGHRHDDCPRHLHHYSQDDCPPTPPHPPHHHRHHPQESLHPCLHSQDDPHLRSTPKKENLGFCQSVAVKFCRC